MSANPFPDVNPFLESQNFWPDFHHEFLTAIRSQIREQLPFGFVARIEERVYVIGGSLRPDVLLVHREETPRTPGTALTLETAPRTNLPLRLRVRPVTVREHYIDIITLWVVGF